jgi:hypothetical protein
MLQNKDHHLPTDICWQIFISSSILSTKRCCEKSLGGSTTNIEMLGVLLRFSFILQEPYTEVVKV